jgi:hypothetical protein
MTGLIILFSVLGAPYLAVNVRRLLQGRRWAYTFCQLAKEWQQADRERNPAERRVQR